jgi:hypothetical protein
VKVCSRTDSSAIANQFCEVFDRFWGYGRKNTLWQGTSSPIPDGFKGILQEALMSEQLRETSSEASRSKSLKQAMIVRFVEAFPLLGLMFFLPAWTFNYWQAWVYMLMLSVPMVFLVRYLYTHDPQLLERRMRIKEKQKTQKSIVAISWICLLPAFILPGFDYRFQWSNHFRRVSSFWLLRCGARVQNQ